jgi:hypothetical protein
MGAVTAADSNLIAGFYALLTEEMFQPLYLPGYLAVRVTRLAFKIRHGRRVKVIGHRVLDDRKVMFHNILIFYLFYTLPNCKFGRTT